jgi:hypothetical protein
MAWQGGTYSRSYGFNWCEALPISASEWAAFATEQDRPKAEALKVTLDGSNPDQQLIDRYLAGHNVKALQKLFAKYGV